MRRSAVWVGWLTLCLILLSIPLAAQEATEAAPIGTPEALTNPEQGDAPPAMPLADEGGYNITNILLLGATTNNDSNNPGLTDSLLIVSLNQDTGNVAVVSIPRDFWVYAPNIGMSKINQVYYFGERQTAGSGIQLLKDTLRYNLGLQIDFYAKVNFDTFAALIDVVDGIDISVDCAIQDWILKPGATNRQDPNSWEMYTLNAGRHTMNGFTALWYVRSRRTSSDIDRGRRQQDVLRAWYRKIRAEGLLENFPALWEQVNQLVETDVTLPDALNLLPMALATDTADVVYYTLELNTHIKNGYSEDEGRFILIPQREALITLMQQVVLPPTASSLRREIPTVAVINATGGRSGMEYVAADRLELEGFRTVVVDEGAPRQGANTIIDYTGLEKSNPIEAIIDVLRIDTSNVTVEADPQREYDYRVFIGSEYRNFSCTRPVEPPKILPTPTPGA